MSQIRALVWKDLQIHWRAAGLLLVGWPIGVRLLVLAVQVSPDATSPPPRALLVAIASLFLFAAVAAGLATMLVQRERTRETLAWVRSLPVSDAHIVIGKNVAWLVFHAVGAVVWWLVLGGVGPALTIPQTVTIWCTTAVVGSLALVSQMAMSRRWAAMVPVGIVALPVLAGAVLDRCPELITRMADVWHGTWEHGLLWMGCLAAYAILVGVGCWRLRATETHAWIE